jgi:hypothetical protein
LHEKLDEAVSRRFFRSRRHRVRPPLFGAFRLKIRGLTGAVRKILASKIQS